ncbi:LRP2-binding protein [Microcaecilia unicolor]|uniref:LRP2-binding protein n=1 Tax=Microcaecilia unicolor TaxID=1415580 RepID=A0A6P7X5D0_9AMPH|nr:LRP2-binding protein [Microcaecilia unicolor]
MRKLNPEPLPRKSRIVLQNVLERGSGSFSSQASTQGVWSQDRCNHERCKRSSSSLPGYEHDILLEKAEEVLKARIKEGDKEASFLLGQLWFEEGWYEDALLHFYKIKEEDLRALYQLGIMYYDGLGTEEDKQKGLEYMLKIVCCENLKAKHLKSAAAFNVGRAYFEGFGVGHSDEEAERWWLLAADNGNPKASVKAQSALGMFYSSTDHKDLKKSYFWHSEACGNGSLESQGALGVMYLHGLGVRKDMESAVGCLKQASERGNVYAQGYLVSYYYKRKMFITTVELATRLAHYEDIAMIAKKTECIPMYVAKGVAMANFYLARCLQLGLGIPQDLTAARKYYTKARDLDTDVTSDLYKEIISGRI